MVFGEGNFRYEEVTGWGNLPPMERGCSFTNIFIDEQGVVSLLCPDESRIIRLDRLGNPIATLADKPLCQVHTMFQRNGNVYGTDPVHQAAYIFNQSGQLLKTLQAKIHHPTHLAAGRNGSVFITDSGNGVVTDSSNACIHKFHPSGNHAFSWGKPGQSPGHFQQPQAIVISNEDILYVADRGNNRIQLFTTEGEFIEQWTTDLIRPTSLVIGPDQLLYVGESSLDATPHAPLDPTSSRISIYNLDGKRQALLESGNACRLSVDGEGSIYTLTTKPAPATEKTPASPDLLIKKYRRI